MHGAGPGTRQSEGTLSQVITRHLKKLEEEQCNEPNVGRKREILKQGAGNKRKRKRNQ